MVAGTAAIGSPGRVTRIFLCPAGYNVFTRSTARPCLLHPPPGQRTCTVYAHTRTVVVPGRSTPSAPNSRRVFNFFFIHDKINLYHLLAGFYFKVYSKYFQTFVRRVVPVKTYSTTIARKKYFIIILCYCPRAGRQHG